MCVDLAWSGARARLTRRAGRGRVRRVGLRAAAIGFAAAGSDAHRCCTAYARYGRQRSASFVALAGSPPCPSCSSAWRTPRSLGRNASGSRSARIAMYSAVHGPIPGSASKRSRASRRSAPASTTSSPFASAATSPSSARRRATRHRERRGIRVRERGGRREHASDSAERSLERVAVRGRQTAGERRGAAHGDLLTEHGADGELVAVDGAGHAPSRCARGRARRAAGRRRAPR